MEPFNPNPYRLLQQPSGIISELERFARHDANITPTGCLGYMKQLLAAAESIPEESMPQQGVSNLERFIEAAQRDRDSGGPARAAQRFAKGTEPASPQEQVAGQVLQGISGILEKVYARDEDWHFAPWPFDEPRFEMRIGQGGRAAAVVVYVDGQTPQGSYLIRVCSMVFNENGGREKHGHWKPKFEDRIFATTNGSGRLKINKGKFEGIYTKAVNALNS